MVKLLTDLIALLRQYPFMVPMAIGAGLVACSIPGQPLFLQLPPIVCEIATDLGIMCIGFGFYIMVTSGMAQRQESKIGGVRDQLAALQAQLSSDSDLTLDERFGLIEESLENTQQTQTRLLEAVDIPYYETDIYGRLTFVNRAYANIFGVSRSSLLDGQSMVHVYSRDRGRVLRESGQALEYQMSYRITARLTDPKGNVKGKVSFIGTPMFDAGGDFVGHYGTLVFKPDGTQRTEDTQLAAEPSLSTADD